MNEWKGKPLGIVSYGAHGGSKASEQAKEILSAMGLRVVETRPQLAFANPMLEMGAILAEGKLSDESRAKWEDDQTTGEIVRVAEELAAVLSSSSTA